MLHCYLTYRFYVWIPRVKTNFTCALISFSLLHKQYKILFVIMNLIFFELINTVISKSVPWKAYIIISSSDNSFAITSVSLLNIWINLIIVTGTQQRMATITKPISCFTYEISFSVLSIFHINNNVSTVFTVRTTESHVYDTIHPFLSTTQQ